MGLKKTLFAVTIGAVAGLFLAKKPGTELHKDLKVTAEKARKDVSKKLARLETISKAAYQEVVDDVLSFYEKAGNLTKGDAKALKADLEGRWKEVEQVLGGKEVKKGKGKKAK